MLVPGGCGYIGAWLIPHLLAQGHKVTAFDTQWFGHGFLPDNDSLRIIKADVRSVSDMNAACEGQDAVICLASISAEAMCQKNPTLARTVNTGGMSSVALSAAKAGVKRFIFASSVAAYGSSSKDAVETDELRPSTIYGEGKKDGEEKVRKAFPSATIVRAASVCGYSPHQRFDLTVNRMVHDAVRKGIITVNGGDQKRSHVHMKDICDFYIQLLREPLKKIEGETFNVVAENMSVRETADCVGEYIACAVIYKPHTDDRSYTVDGSKAAQVLGFRPRRTVKDAVRDLKVKFDCGYWPDSTSNQIYMNLADGIN